jgi:hypothetical protein
MDVPWLGKSRDRLRSYLIVTLIGSVLAGAGLGIVLVLINSWGWYEIRVLLTTVVLAVASLCGLAAHGAKTPKGFNILPWTGIILTALSSALIVGMMWTDVNDDDLWLIPLVLSFFALATVHVCLLSIAPLAAGFRWVYFVAMQISFGVAGLSAAMVFMGGGDGEVGFRLLAVLIILAVACSLIIPLLSWQSRRKARAVGDYSAVELRNLAEVDSQIAFHRQKIVELEKLRFKLTDQPSTSHPIVASSYPLL